MEINVNGKNIVLRNLEEQVQKNKEDIARHYAIDRALANFGIKIVGRADNADELPNPETYAGTYGDAYAVGTAPPYTYWIYTRPDPNQGIATDYWLDVGEISVQGPEGPIGPQGPQGEPGTSTRWYFGSTVPTASANDGDIFLISSGASLGNIYGYTGQTWVLLGNIRGPQGIQGIQGQRGTQGVQGPMGPQGPQGPSGQSFHIEGVLDTPAQLPTPTQAIRAGAYLVGTAAPYDIYIIEGGHDEGDILLWVNAGNITSIPGIPGPTGPQGVAGKNGFSIFRSTATSIVNNTIQLSSITNLEGRAVQVGDLVLIGQTIHDITAVNGLTLTVSQTGTDIQGEKGEEGEPGKVEYEVFSISSVYQPDFGIYINLPTIYKEVEVLSILITPPSGKYGHYYWDSKGVPKKIIQDGKFIVGSCSFPMIKGSDGTSPGTISGSPLNTNYVLNADGSQGMITIGLKTQYKKWSGEDLTTGHPTGIILLKCVR